MYQGTLRQRLMPLPPTLGIPALLVISLMGGGDFSGREYEGFADWFDQEGWIVLVTIIVVGVLIRWGKHFLPRMFPAAPPGSLSTSREAASNRAKKIMARIYGFAFILAFFGSRFLDGQDFRNAMFVSLLVTVMIQANLADLIWAWTKRQPGDPEALAQA